MGGFLPIIVAMIIWVLIIALVSYCKFNMRGMSMTTKIKLKNMIKSVYDKVFWIQVLLLGIHSYIKFAISVMINVKT
jgi:hypothetical protein